MWTYSSENGVLYNKEKTELIKIPFLYTNDTVILPKTVTTIENSSAMDLINVKTKLDVDFNDSEIIVRALKQPNCSNVDINDNTIKFNIDKELGIEVVGETKVKIAIEEDEDPWDIIDDDFTDEEEKQIDEEVNEDYL